MTSTTNSHDECTRVILRNIKSGDIYVADTDGFTGEVYNAVGPLHHAEVATVFADESPNWDDELAEDLNRDIEVLAPTFLPDASA